MGVAKHKKERVALEFRRDCGSDCAVGQAHRTQEPVVCIISFVFNSIQFS